MGKSPRPAPASPSIKSWTPYGIVGFYRRRRWRLNWRLFGWFALNGAGWLIIYAAVRWL